LDGRALVGESGERVVLAHTEMVSRKRQRKRVGVWERALEIARAG
jgi:hypothetical protein